MAFVGFGVDFESVFFSCFLSGNAIFPYEKFKAKYGTARNSAGFNNGLDEMEKNATIYQYGIVSIGCVCRWKFGCCGRRCDFLGLGID